MACCIALISKGGRNDSTVGIIFRAIPEVDILQNKHERLCTIDRINCSGKGTETAAFLRLINHTMKQLFCSIYSFTKFTNQNIKSQTCSSSIFIVIVTIHSVESSYEFGRPRMVATRLIKQPWIMKKFATQQHPQLLILISL